MYTTTAKGVRKNKDSSTTASSGSRNKNKEIYAKYKAQPESFIYGKVKALKIRSRT